VEHGLILRSIAMELNRSPESSKTNDGTSAD
jgi:hypothetical protein